MPSRTPRSPISHLTRLTLAAAVLAAVGLGAAPSAHAGPARPGATGLHEAMMPAGSPDARSTTGSPSAGSSGRTPSAAAQPTGVDVSRWQHPSGVAIDWGQVAASGQRFAIVKATELYTDTTTGQPVLYTNPYLSQDLAAARAAGLVVGSYAFAHPENSPTDQADAFAAAVGPIPDGSLPPVLDLELDGGLSVGQLVSWTQAFLDRVEQDTGIVPMIYSGPGFWNSSMGGSTAFTGYPLWEAHWTSAAAPAPMGGWSTWNLWQFTSTASVPGISGYVDESRFNGTDPATLAQRVAPASISAPATLAPGQSLRSPDQRYQLLMQPDGNLVEYVDGGALWSTGTWNSPGATLALQSDGNLVVYSAAGVPIWNTGTYGAGPGGRLSVRDDGNVRLTAGGHWIWSNRIHQG